MDKEKLKELLEDVKMGKVPVAKAMKRMKALPFEDLGFAKIDTHRALRKGFPEVIYCPGKKLKHIVGIFEKTSSQKLIMATRASRKIFRAVKKVRDDVAFKEQARIIIAGKIRKKTKKIIAITSAGTADIPVAEEAAVTAEVLGNPVERIFDVGVAGVHRLFAQHDKLTRAHVIVVVAGMEGALASVVGGVVSHPVIAVPTSVGYGANFQGIAPLLTMLNSCAPGVAVVNIDSGFGAGYMAGLINQNK